MVFKLLFVVVHLWRMLHPDDLRSEKVLRGVAAGDGWKGIKKGTLSFSPMDWATAVLHGTLQFYLQQDDSGYAREFRLFPSRIITQSFSFFFRSYTQGSLCWREKMERHRIKLLLARIPPDRASKQWTEVVAETLRSGVFTFVDFASVPSPIVRPNPLLPSLHSSFLLTSNHFLPFLICRLMIILEWSQSSLPISPLRGSSAILLQPSSSTEDGSSSQEMRPLRWLRIPSLTSPPCWGTL